MTTLRDKGRELISIAEGEIERREATIVALRHEVERLRKELAEAKDQKMNIMPARCANCAYRIVGMKVLEAKEKVEKGSRSEGD